MTLRSDVGRMARASPLYFVGDSNCLFYRDLVVDTPRYFAWPIATSACYLHGLTAATILQNGAVDERLLLRLQTEGVIAKAERWQLLSNLSRLAEEQRWLDNVRRGSLAMRKFQFSPVLVLFVGTMDLSGILAALGPACDFELNDEKFVASRFDPRAVPLVPVTPVVEMIRARLAPVGEALRLLGEIGFKYLYLHSLHPPTVDDAHYFQVRRVMSAASMRYKVAILINRVFAEIARDSGAGFLDMWDATVRDGVVDPKFYYDGDHLNLEASKLTIEAVLADILARRGRELDREELAEILELENV